MTIKKKLYANTLEGLTRFLKDLEELTAFEDNRFAKLRDVLDIHWYFAIANTYHDMMLKLAVALFDDPDEWIHWYAYENKFGKGKMTGNGKIIDTPRKLWRILQAGKSHI